MDINTLLDILRSVSFGIFLSAFLGAFFAFLFTRFGTLADKLFTRKQKHRTALVGIEKQGNEYQNFIGDNLFVINDYVTIANKNIANEQPFLYFNELHELPIDKTLATKLGNLDMVNDLFSIEASVVKINSSIRSLNRFREMMEQAFINKNIDLATYLANIKILIAKLAEIAVFLNDLEEENKNLVAKARVLIHKGNKSFYIFLLGRIMKKKFTKRQLKKIPLELKKLNEEIEETKSTDRKRIDKLLELIEGSKNDR